MVTTRRAGRRCRGRGARRAAPGRRARAGGTRARATSWAGSSILFAITSTGLCERRRIAASSSSPGITPARASATNRTRSASAIAACACAATERVIGERSAMSTPPVSISRKRLPVPLADELLAVARDAGRLVHDGRARRGQPVDERRLADVREADDRHGPQQRQSSTSTPASFCSVSDDFIVRLPPGKARLRRLFKAHPARKRCYWSTFLGSANALGQPWR